MIQAADGATFALATWKGLGCRQAEAHSPACADVTGTGGAPGVLQRCGRPCRGNVTPAAQDKVAMRNTNTTTPMPQHQCHNTNATTSMPHAGLESSSAHPPVATLLRSSNSLSDATPQSLQYTQGDFLQRRIPGIGPPRARKGITAQGSEKHSQLCRQQLMLPLVHNCANLGTKSRISRLGPDAIGQSQAL